MSTPTDPVPTPILAATTQCHVLNVWIWSNPCPDTTFSGTTTPHNSDNKCLVCGQSPGPLSREFFLNKRQPLIQARALSDSCRSQFTLKDHELHKSHPFIHKIACLLKCLAVSKNKMPVIFSLSASVCIPHQFYFLLKACMPLGWRESSVGKVLDYICLQTWVSSSVPG